MSPFRIAIVRRLDELRGDPTPGLHSVSIGDKEWTDPRHARTDRERFAEMIQILASSGARLRRGPSRARVYGMQLSQAATGRVR